MVGGSVITFGLCTIHSRVDSISLNIGMLGLGLGTPFVSVVIFTV